LSSISIFGEFDSVGVPVRLRLIVDPSFVLARRLNGFRAGIGGVGPSLKSPVFTRVYIDPAAKLFPGETAEASTGGSGTPDTVLGGVAYRVIELPTDA
jgi:hypothetical protein